jgi:hypothetical protein
MRENRAIPLHAIFNFFINIKKRLTVTFEKAIFEISVGNSLDLKISSTSLVTPKQTTVFLCCACT